MSNNFWDKTAESYDKDMQTHGELYDRSIERALSLLKSRDTVLDFGCASGEHSLEIAAHVQRVHGIDPSGNMIEIAQRKAQERQVDNVRFDQIDVFSPSLQKQTYTAVIAFNVFHLVDELPRIIARLHDLLRPGGLLISQSACLADRKGLMMLILNIAQRFSFVPSIYKFTVPELEDYHTRNGFDIVESMVWEEENNVQWIVAKK